MSDKGTKKRIVILTVNPSAGASYKEELERIFGEDCPEILTHTPSSYLNQGHIPEVNLYMISKGAIEYTGEMEFQVPLGVPVVDISVVFERKSLELVASLPKGTRCLLVNSTEPLALECIVEFHKHSIYNVQLTPMYPGSCEYPDIDVALTAGEPELVPPYIKTVYDLGHRKLSPEIVLQVLIHLGMEYVAETEGFRQYAARFDTFSKNEVMLLNRSCRLQAGIDILIRATEGGAIGINEEKRIFCINDNAIKILELGDDNPIGKNYKDVIPFIDFDEYASNKSEDSTFRSLFNHNGTDLTVTVRNIIYNGKFLGVFVNIQRFIDVENKQHDARMCLINRGHTAKYTFDDIVGETAIMKETCRMAKRMARTNATILISGESGTGKELLASAIHNASRRAAYPYVAINCAAIPENLLESELFGYEEGAFTGASKKGKLGLFEHAHRGTIFLDEIEDMSPALQVKLLRVLQEKEVMRVGGNKLINVDVRIIAATNADIDTMVKQGLIRKDLYYRLNTMQLNLPPLRDRKADIPALIDRMQKQLDCSYTISDEVMKYIMKHKWDGNVRELHNYVEYFQCLEKSRIEIDDLPARLLDEADEESVTETVSKDEGCIISTGRGDLSEEESFVMMSLYRSFLDNRLIGRRTICEEARRSNLIVTEQEVRKILKKLEAAGLVKVGSGRAGSRLTPQGLSLAEGRSKYEM